MRLNQRNKLKLFSKNEEKGLRVIAQESDGNIFLGGSSPDSYLFIYNQKEDKLVNISVKLPFSVKGDFHINQIYT